jgi:hypothetical protein
MASDVADGLIGGFARFRQARDERMRLSCQRPFTFAPFFAVFHDVLSVTIGFVGSSGLFLPNSGLPIRAGKTYHSGLMVWNRFVYHLE